MNPRRTELEEKLEAQLSYEIERRMKAEAEVERLKKELEAK